MVSVQVCKFSERLNRAWAVVAIGLAAVLSNGFQPNFSRAGEDQKAEIGVQLVSTSATGETVSAVAALPCSHEQVKFISPVQGDTRRKLASFCVTKDGQIVAVLDRQDPVANNDGLLSAFVTVFTANDNSGQAPASSPDNANAKKAKSLDSIAEVRILDSDGNLLEQWPLDFEAQAVNVCPDGNLVLGGAGVLARYDLKGKELARSESPHIVAARKDPEQLKKQAQEMVEQSRNSMKEALKSLEEQKVELAKKDDKSLTDEERQTKQQIDMIIASYKQQVAQQGDKPISDEEISAMVQNLESQSRRINAVSSNGKFIFCTAPASKGYGYSVWRTSMDFAEPKRIVDGLSGCCGQMDIQCCGDDIVVAENSRKRVVRYDANGKEVNAWGKGSRDGEGDTFGSCCNPMNTRAVGDKLYVSDSDGRVRLFTLDGKYESEVGKADVQPGCKSSIVDVAPQGNRVYYIDVNNSRICVLDKKSSKPQAVK